MIIVEADVRPVHGDSVFAERIAVDGMDPVVASSCDFDEGITVYAIGDSLLGTQETIVTAMRACENRQMIFLPLVSKGGPHNQGTKWKRFVESQNKNVGQTCIEHLPASSAV